MSHDCKRTRKGIRFSAASDSSQVSVKQSKICDNKLRRREHMLPKTVEAMSDPPSKKPREKQTSDSPLPFKQARIGNNMATDHVSPRELHHELAGLKVCFGPNMMSTTSSHNGHAIISSKRTNDIIRDTPHRQRAKGPLCLSACKGRCPKVFCL